MMQHAVLFLTSESGNRRYARSNTVPNKRIWEHQECPSTVPNKRNCEQQEFLSAVLNKRKWEQQECPITVPNKRIWELQELTPKKQERMRQQVKQAPNR